MVRNPLPTVIVADPDPAYQRYLTALLVEGFRCIITGTLRETYQAIGNPGSPTAARRRVVAMLQVERDLSEPAEPDHELRDLTLALAPLPDATGIA